MLAEEDGYVLYRSCVTCGPSWSGCPTRYGPACAGRASSKLSPGA